MTTRITITTHDWAVQVEQHETNQYAVDGTGDVVEHSTFTQSVVPKNSVREFNVHGTKQLTITEVPNEQS